MMKQNARISIICQNLPQPMQSPSNVVCLFAIVVAGMSDHFCIAQNENVEDGEGSKNRSTIYTVLAFFLIFCSAASGLFTIYLVKWEFDRLYIFHKLYKKGLPIIGQVRRRESSPALASSVAGKQRHRRRASTVRRKSLFDFKTPAEQAHRQALVGCVVEVTYEMEDESDGTVIQCLAGFNDETLHKRVTVGSSVQLLVHPQNYLIARPIGTNKRSCMSRDSSGRVEALCEVAVGTLSLVTGVFCITFAVFLHQLFMAESASLEFDISNVIGWVLCAIAILLLLIPLLPRLTSSQVTEMEFENAREVVSTQESIAEEQASS